MYDALSMEELILYQTASFCAFCTFQWLAELLLNFLALLHFVFRDWGVAIIGLVIVVRALLHPLTKKSQITMQRFSKKMSGLKPEIDKLQKKYANDPRKLQAENIKLMREQGVNPMQMLGCLPLFLQTPSGWRCGPCCISPTTSVMSRVLRVFRLRAGWPFLSDLSARTASFPAGGGIHHPASGTRRHRHQSSAAPARRDLYISEISTPPQSPMTVGSSSSRNMKGDDGGDDAIFMYAAPSGLTST